MARAEFRFGSRKVGMVFERVAVLSVREHDNLDSESDVVDCCSAD